jgi:hypothetical protein
MRTTTIVALIALALCRTYPDACTNGKPTPETEALYAAKTKLGKPARQAAEEAAEEVQNWRDGTEVPRSKQSRYEPVTDLPGVVMSEGSQAAAFREEFGFVPADHDSKSKRYERQLTNSRSRASIVEVNER